MRKTPRRRRDNLGKVVGFAVQEIDEPLPESEETGVKDDEGTASAQAVEIGEGSDDQGARAAGNIESVSPSQDTSSEPATVEETAVQETTVEEPAVHESAVQESAVQEPPIEELAVEEKATQEPAVEKTAVEKPAVEETTG